MKIELINHNLQYEIESMCDIFFSGWRKKEDDTLVVSEFLENKNLACKTTITYLGKLYSAYDSCECTDFYNKKMVMKRSFYKAASAATNTVPNWGVITGIRPAKIASPLLEVYSVQETAQILKDEYLLSNDNIDIMIKCSNFSKKASELIDEKYVSIYISIPYCPSRCNYCSFVSASTENEIKTIDRYLELLYEEIDIVEKNITSKNLKVATIYIGGGTPTILTAKQLEQLISVIDKSFKLKSLLEFTIEAGRPDTITEEKLISMKKIITPRISINPQTLNDIILQKIGRRHTTEQFFSAFSLARFYGYNNINVDLIAGLKGDNYDDFCASLDKIIELSPENITIHSLSVKRASNLSLSDNESYNTSDDNVKKMVLYAKQKLSCYLPYYMYKQRNTVSNLENIGYTKNNFECLYNIYMMNELHTVIGIGAGAVTKIVNQNNNKINRIANYKLPIEYISFFDKMVEERIEKFNSYEF